jgi:hypothetical protein
MIKATVVASILAASPAIAAQTPLASPGPAEAEPPCTGQCAEVFLKAEIVKGNQCVWASNSDPSAMTVVLTLADGTSAQFTLKGGNSYTAANAPYDNRSCDVLDRKVQIMNEHLSSAAIEATAAMDPGMMQELKTCYAQETAAHEADWEKGEYYSLGSRPVRRKSTLGIGGSFMSTETYPVYWMRLKIGGICLNALHDIRSYSATLK